MKTLTILLIALLSPIYLGADTENWYIRFQWENVTIGFNKDGLAYLEQICHGTHDCDYKMEVREDFFVLRDSPSFESKEILKITKRMLVYGIKDRYYIIPGVGRLTENNLEANKSLDPKAMILSYGLISEDVYIYSQNDTLYPGYLDYDCIQDIGREIAEKNADCGYLVIKEKEITYGEYWLFAIVFDQNGEELSRGWIYNFDK